MARKKRVVRRKKTRAVRSRPKVKRSRRRSAAGNPLMKSALYSGGYGAIRGMTSDAVVPLVARVPMLNNLGEYVDNAVMIGITGLAASGKIPGQRNVPMLRELGKSGWMVEWALLGSDMVQRFRNKSTPTAPGNSAQVIG